MIKFFRHIRRNLIETGKTGKYFKYAIGEIILVVIGILIALQINNWNETQKEKQKEQELLTYVLENLKTDSLSIVSLISKTDRILKVHQDLINISKGEISSTSIHGLDLIRSSEPNQLITKKNNPNLPNEVRSQDLKKSIIDYFLAIEWLEFTVVNNNQIIEQSVRPFLGEKKLLNYGNQLERNLTKMNLINNDRFFEEFNKEEIQQILFESGLKFSIMKMNADRTMIQNTKVKNAIHDYLND